MRMCVYIIRVCSVQTCSRKSRHFSSAKGFSLENDISWLKGALREIVRREVFLRYFQSTAVRSDTLNSMSSART